MEMVYEIDVQWQPPLSVMPSCSASAGAGSATGSVFGEEATEEEAMLSVVALFELCTQLIVLLVLVPLDTWLPNSRITSQPSVPVN